MKLKNIYSYYLGEIVLWDEKDQGGYMIDNHGEWAKIEGRQWLGSSILKNCTKTSFSKRLIYNMIVFCQTRTERSVEVYRVEIWTQPPPPQTVPDIPSKFK